MPDIIVIGGGPAGLMAAETAAQGGARVHLFDRMPTLARKFLMAGRSGLNLTHSEPFDTFLTRYGASATRLRPALEQFPTQQMRQLKKQREKALKDYDDAAEPQITASIA